MKRCLIVDDNEQNRDILEIILQRAGYEVESACDGIEALEKAHRHPPDLAISDILMPEMDGFTLCRKWRCDEELKTIPFVFYSATYTDSQDKRFALSLGADRFLVKPMEPDAFIDMIWNVLTEYQTGRLVASQNTLDDEKTYLQRHDETLFHKLEKKVQNLEGIRRNLEHEIAERKRAEDALRESEERFRAIFEGQHAAVLIIDANTHVIIDANSAAISLIGATREEILGKVCHTFICPAERGQCPITDLGQTIDRSERILLTQNGARIPVLKAVNRVTFRERDYLVESFLDISDRKQTEHALRESEARYRELFDNMPSGVAVYDVRENGQDFIFKDFNKAAERIDGQPREDLIGRSLFEARPGVEQFGLIDAFRKVLQTGKPVVHPVKLYQDERLSGWYENVVYKLPSGEIVAVFENLTQQKQTEEELQQYREHLEDLVETRTAELAAANRELKDFAYIVSHDLKAPLRAVSRLAQWLVEDYQNVVDTKGQEMIGLLVERIKRMDNLIDSILEYSRIGRMVGKHVALDLNTIVSHVIENLVPPKHTRIVVENTLPTVTGDKIRLEQVFQNLLSNAIKFMDKAEGCIMVGCVEEETYWWFYVKDNGPGIDPRHHEKIFQIFQTLHMQDTTESTGVGLAIVKRIVEFCGGTVGVESSVGQGSTFWFTLPKA